MGTETSIPAASAKTSLSGDPGAVDARLKTLSEPYCQVTDYHTHVIDATKMGAFIFKCRLSMSRELVMEMSEVDLASVSEAHLKHHENRHPPHGPRVADVWGFEHIDTMAWCPE